MELSVPIQIDEQALAKSISSIVKETLKSEVELNKLPPYPSSRQVCMELHIGTRKLKEWVAEGLPCQRWSERDIRFDRDELKEWLSTHKTL